jgi:hypothetical protein
MIRYTAETVLPRLAGAIAEVRQEDAEAERKISKGMGLRPRPHLPVVSAGEDVVQATG